MTYLHYRILALSAFLFSVSGFAAWAKPGARAHKRNPETVASRPDSPVRLDSVAVHDLYLEGEFDTAIAVLEACLKGSRQFRREDSIFIFKHLGVMLAAQFDTREKGKYYLHRLLSIEPTAKITDMYASDMIYMIFRNIQEEYEQKRLYAAKSNRPQAESGRPSGPRAGYSADSVEPVEAAKPRAKSSRPSHGKKWIWGGAAVVTVAAGVGAYLALQPRVLRQDYQY